MAKYAIVNKRWDIYDYGWVCIFYDTTHRNFLEYKARADYAKTIHHNYSLLDVSFTAITAKEAKKLIKQGTPAKDYRNNI